MKIWVVTGVSESSDHFGPFLFSEEPTKKLLKKIVRSCDGDELSEGPGNFGSYVYLEVSEEEVNEFK